MNSERNDASSSQSVFAMKFSPFVSVLGPAPAFAASILRDSTASLMVPDQAVPLAHLGNVLRKLCLASFFTCRVFSSVGEGGRTECVPVLAKATSPAGRSGEDCRLHLWDYSRARGHSPATGKGSMTESRLAGLRNLYRRQRSRSLPHDGSASLYSRLIPKWAKRRNVGLLLVPLRWVVGGRTGVTCHRHRLNPRFNLASDDALSQALPEHARPALRHL